MYKKIFLNSMFISFIQNYSKALLFKSREFLRIVQIVSYYILSQTIHRKYKKTEICSSQMIERATSLYFGIYSMVWNKLKHERWIIRFKKESVCLVPNKKLPFQGLFQTSLRSYRVESRCRLSIQRNVKSGLFIKLQSFEPVSPRKWNKEKDREPRNSTQAKNHQIAHRSIHLQRKGHIHLNFFPVFHELWRSLKES